MKSHPLSPDQLATCLQRIASGETVTAVARSLNISRPQLFAELNASPALRDAYSRARLEQGHALADLAAEAAEELSDPRMERVARLKFDARKWLAAMTNASYRDRMIQDVAGEVTLRLVDETRKNTAIEDAQIVEELPGEVERHSLPLPGDTTATPAEGDSGVTSSEHVA